MSVGFPIGQSECVWSSEDVMRYEAALKKAKSIQARIEIEVRQIFCSPYTKFYFPDLHRRFKQLFPQVPSSPTASFSYDLKKFHKQPEESQPAFAKRMGDKYEQVQKFVGDNPLFFFDYVAIRQFLWEFQHVLETRSEDCANPDIFQGFFPAVKQQNPGAEVEEPIEKVEELAHEIKQFIDVFDSRFLIERINALKELTAFCSGAILDSINLFERRRFSPELFPRAFETVLTRLESETKAELRFVMKNPESRYSTALNIINSMNVCDFSYPIRMEMLREVSMGNKQLQGHFKMQVEALCKQVENFHLDDLDESSDLTLSRSISESDLQNLL